MPDEKFLIIQLHDCSVPRSHQASHGAGASHRGLIAPHMSAPIDASYLGGTGYCCGFISRPTVEVRHAISMIKMRGGDHEARSASSV